MTSELRSAVEVWREAEAEAIEYNGRLIDSDYAAAAVIEAYGDEREAKGREEQAAELAKYKALAETLAGALEESWGLNVNYEAVEEDDGYQFTEAPAVIAEAAEALRQYKEARDER